MTSVPLELQPVAIKLSHHHRTKHSNQQFPTYQLLPTSQLKIPILCQNTIFSSYQHKLSQSVDQNNRPDISNS
uniref:Uncharacterized protein n=1 Tax=Octopus bimaculoides TaxID=37653 RepID=A0A0L8FYL7_OCTBM